MSRTRRLSRLGSGGLKVTDGTESERLYWDEATLLSQLGLIDPSLPFADVTEVGGCLRDNVQRRTLSAPTSCRRLKASSPITADREMKKKRTVVGTLAGVAVLTAPVAHAAPVADFLRQMGTRKTGT